MVDGNVKMRWTKWRTIAGTISCLVLKWRWTLLARFCGDGGVARRKTLEFFFFLSITFCVLYSSSLCTFVASFFKYYRRLNAGNHLPLRPVVDVSVYSSQCNFCSGGCLFSYTSTHDFIIFALSLFSCVIIRLVLYCSQVMNLKLTNAWKEILLYFLEVLIVFSSITSNLYLYINTSYQLLMFKLYRWLNINAR